jgi:P-type conjugative transfer protein TrbJ
MMKFRLTGGVLAVVAAVVVAQGEAYAWGIVFDPTNFIQTTVTAGQSLKATADRAIQLRTQLAQYNTQLQNLKSLSPEDLARQQRQNMEDLNNVNSFIGAVNTNYGSVQNVQSVMSRRFEEQRTSGMSWQDYWKSEDQRRQQGVQGAADRARNDRIALEKVNRDYEQVQEWGQKIPRTEGVHSSMQLMNAQMNKVITQNAEVIKSMSVSSMAGNQEAIDRSTERQAFKNRTAEEAREGSAVRARELQELSSLKGR